MSDVVLTKSDLIGTSLPTDSVRSAVIGDAARIVIRLRFAAATDIRYPIRAAQPYTA